MLLGGVDDPEILAHLNVIYATGYTWHTGVIGFNLGIDSYPQDAGGKFWKCRIAQAPADVAHIRRYT